MKDIYLVYKKNGTCYMVDKIYVIYGCIRLYSLDTPIKYMFIMYSLGVINIYVFFSIN